MKFKKLLALGLIVSSMLVISHSAFAVEGCKPCTERCVKKCTPGQGCEYWCY